MPKKKRRIRKGLVGVGDLIDKVLDVVDGVGKLVDIFERSKIEEGQVNQESPYEVMGLTLMASEREVKTRYRQLMKMYHPDAGSGSDPMAKKINAAYEEIKRERGWT